MTGVADVYMILRHPGSTETKALVSAMLSEGFVPNLETFLNSFLMKVIACYKIYSMIKNTIELIYEDDQVNSDSLNVYPWTWNVTDAFYSLWLVKTSDDLIFSWKIIIDCLTFHSEELFSTFTILVNVLQLSMMVLILVYLPKRKRKKHDHQKFVVLSWKRTGSNLLSGILHKHPEILMHNELFNPIGILTYHPNSLTLDSGSQSKRWNYLGRDMWPSNFLDHIWSARYSDGSKIKQQSKAVGFKSFPDHWTDSR